MLQAVLSYLFVSVLWGCTNPFISEGTKPEHAEGAGTFSVLKNLLRWKALLPFAINQTGSLAYYYLLGSQEISLTVPICNSLTFVFTAITSIIIGEAQFKPLQTAAGIALTVLGVAVCVLSQQQQDLPEEQAQHHQARLEGLRHPIQH